MIFSFVHGNSVICVWFVQNHLDADSSFQVHYTNYLTNLAQQWTRLYSVPKCVTELLREDSELLEKCLRQIRPFFCMSAGAVKGRVVLVRVSSQSLLKRVFVNLKMSHNKISMHVILLKCGLRVHCMHISSHFFFTLQISWWMVFLRNESHWERHTSSPLRGQAGTWTLRGD